MISPSFPISHYVIYFHSFPLASLVQCAVLCRKCDGGLGALRANVGSNFLEIREIENAGADPIDRQSNALKGNRRKSGISFREVLPHH